MCALFGVVHNLKQLLSPSKIPLLGSQNPRLQRSPLVNSTSAACPRGNGRLLVLPRWATWVPRNAPSGTQRSSTSFKLRALGGGGVFDGLSFCLNIQCAEKSMEISYEEQHIMKLSFHSEGMTQTFGGGISPD